MDPSTFLCVAYASNPLCLRAPWDACAWMLEVCFRDDRRLFGKTPEALDQVLQANCHARWEAGSTVNAVKWKGFCLTLEEGAVSARGLGTPSWV